MDGVTKSPQGIETVCAKTTTLVKIRTRFCKKLNVVAENMAGKVTFGLEV